MNSNDGGHDKVGISFAAIFILVYHVSFWVCGLAHSLSWDYAPGVPQGEAANVRVSWREKPIGGFIWRQILKLRRGVDGDGDLKSADSLDEPHLQIELGNLHLPGVRDKDKVSTGTPQKSPHYLVSSFEGLPNQPQLCHGLETALAEPIPTRPEVPSWASRVLGAIRMVVTPISVVVALSVTIALVKPLKALFVESEGGPSWEGPDGKPPLAFVIQTGSSVPPSSAAKFSDDSSGYEKLNL